MMRFQLASSSASWPLIKLRLMRANREGKGTGSGPQKDKTGGSTSGNAFEVALRPVAVAVAVAEGILPLIEAEYDDAPRVCLALVGGREEGADEAVEECDASGGEEEAEAREEADEAEQRPPAAAATAEEEDSDDTDEAEEEAEGVGVGRGLVVLEMRPE